MEKGGLYNRGSIMLSKSKRQVNKNHTFAVSLRLFSNLFQDKEFEETNDAFKKKQEKMQV